ncbi:Beta-barrel assembly machine subunit BamD [Desulfacinum hydrothermale DSM 13146]|uniref:Beta-barrel assembly machine subunit BamD n=1 Tax=Desulfacinum hydrothermale DSM 13146 TaxID=1121390 RepID=A0A1W1XQT2_9BACT|nr:outer membrane protein assembly factor BamD [Desulfacinum hydrothermale]SMC26227.1 Beta-barrel assembly machine subunit BamD [Desulfacinum hydrothermale DSM 13146]
MSGLFIGKTHRRLIGAALLVMACSLLSGCGTNLLSYYFDDLFQSGDTIERTPEQLAWDGVQAMREKDYDEALDAFQKLKERYPYSKYAILAELKVGDAYFFKKKYADAALAYEEFIRLHPRNEVVPYVLYQLGMCHFLSFKSTDRDMEETRLAMEAFKRLTQAFPTSPYATKAQKQIHACRKRLAEHEFQVGRIYYRMEKYKAARLRLTRLLMEYPQAVKDLGYHKEIQEILADCRACLNRGDDGKSLWTKLGF